MKNRIVSLVIFLALLTSCSKKSEKVEGNWQVVYITPSENIKSDGEQTAFTWLNILSEKSSITFRNDSLFVNNNFHSKYKLQNSEIYYKKGDDFLKAYDYNFNNDTLILESSSENVIIKMKKKSP
ncbi:hypothetical protein CEN47_21870 [Fischerella thermalis CCMEE 5319]|jgi:hypothetical protein|nr:hypothetical protein CEN47_21870 [Fischerella thermalis CCMEE 5319]